MLFRALVFVSLAIELIDGMEDLLEVRDVSKTGSLDVVPGDDCASVGGLGLFVEVVGITVDSSGGKKPTGLFRAGFHMTGFIMN